MRRSFSTSAGSPSVIEGVCWICSWERIGLSNEITTRPNLGRASGGLVVLGVGSTVCATAGVSGATAGLQLITEATFRLRMFVSGFETELAMAAERDLVQREGER